MALKPWYKIVEPRENLREGRPLDALEYAKCRSQGVASRGGPDKGVGR